MKGMFKEGWGTLKRYDGGFLENQKHRHILAPSKADQDGESCPQP